MSFLHKKVSILCIGDVMLDRFVSGKMERMSPEAPVPIFRKTGEESMLGGAGNVARNLSGLGATCTLLASIGKDKSGEQVQDLCAQEMGCHFRPIHCDERPTTMKTRLVAAQQQVVRIDDEETHPLSTKLGQQLLDAAFPLIDQADVVILSDYHKGVLNEHTLAALISKCRETQTPVLIDPRPANVAFYQGATIITPNLKEFKEICHHLNLTSAMEEERAIALMRKLSLEALLLTKGAEGMTLYSPTEAPFHIDAKARQVFDVSGAGDTVISTLAYGIGAGINLQEAAQWANEAGHIVVGRPGTAPIYKEDLEHLSDTEENVLNMTRAKICTGRQLSEDLTKWRAEGLKVGFTNGCFDLLHPGHIKLLSQARDNCDRLIVGLNTDASVQNLKGPGRPVQDQNARSFVMASQTAVDRVILFDAPTPEALIRQVCPDVLIKGADYTRDQVVGGEFVEANGGKIVLIDLVADKSTTNLIQKATA